MADNGQAGNSPFCMADAMKKVDDLIKYKGPLLNIYGRKDLITRGKMKNGNNLSKNPGSEFIGEPGLKAILKQDGKRNNKRKRDGLPPTFPENRFNELCLAFELVGEERRLFKESSGAEFEEYLQKTYPTPQPRSDTATPACQNPQSGAEAASTLETHETHETLATLQSLIADMLAARGKAAEWLAPRLDVKPARAEELREGTAKALVQAEVKTLFDLWLAALNGQGELGRDDARFVEAVIHAALPATYPYLEDPQSIRAGQAGKISSIALVACHQTLAEIAVAAADRRRALFKRPDDEPKSRNAYPGGEGQLARVFGAGPEVGRNAEGRQTQADFVSELAGSMECCFDDVAERFPHFLRRTYGAEHPGLAEEAGPLTEKVVNWIRAKLESMAEDRAFELDSKGRSGYTFYAVVETPPDLPREVRAHQDEILRELKTLFPQIAFLRLAPLDDHFSDQMIRYNKLRDRLRRASQDQNP